MKKIAFYNATGYADVVNLDVALLRTRFEWVPDGSSADAVLCWKNPAPGVDPARCVILQSEPPLAAARVRAYEHAASYLGFFCFDIEAVPGARPITADPLCYPYVPAMSTARPVREGFEGGVRFYFAGMKGNWRHLARFGAEPIYRHRYELAIALGQRFPGSMIVGDGFAQVTKQGSGELPSPVTEYDYTNGSDLPLWRQQKWLDLDRCDATHMLCHENVALRQYVSEKLMDGFRSGLVFAYLGDPDIARWVPQECFIDLRRFWKDGAVDQEAFFEAVQRMSPAQCRDMVAAARSFAHDFDRRHERAKEDLTQRVMALLSERL